ncbi:patatin-like phospholipase [Oleiphilus messinensis]|uniref:Patatin-like phospholipase n=2 Tax=Oleiphilus messinensis TaxID=141451 RepID=A0A1Y0IBG6_9GAMM|nr:patatin-like phospholipase [Oleiphilus messinensis]
MEHASSYDEWLETATELDHLEGAHIWRSNEDSPFYHASLVREHLQQMRRLRASRNAAALMQLLHESLYRHLNEVGSPALYRNARTGTKFLISNYLDEVEKCMIFLRDTEIQGITAEDKLQMFRQAEQVFGKPALMLSGGGAFGIYHLGVLKALWEQNLLPDIISGSSMGAIIAAGVCSRTPEELKTLLTDPDSIHLNALKWLPLTKIVRQKVAMDQAQIKEHIETNIGPYTFEEAFARSGKVLNISVSPTRLRQKPRLLTHKTSPNVTLHSAALASCAIPALYPPVTLFSKDSNGHQSPYLPTERWVDGTIHSDLPILRIARLHNVNQTIVSQANPHVIPFIRSELKAGRPSLKHLLIQTLRAQTYVSLDSFRQLFGPSSTRNALDQAHELLKQSYLGDINICFPFQPKMYRKVISNPTPKDLRNYITLGERATWPQIQRIRDLTRISRTFAQCLETLENAAQTNSATTRKYPAETV